MPQKISPFIEGKYGWNYGESGWNSGMDENLTKFSFLFDRNIDAIVSTLPSNPANGQAFFLTTDNRMYFRVESSWFSTPTPKWFEFQIRSTGIIYKFDGTSVSVVESPSSFDSRIDELEVVASELGTAAFEDSDYFATQANLDVVSAQANSYTEELVSKKGILSVLDYINTAVDGVTSNQAGIEEAVAAAYASGAELYWPAGTYVSTANIPNFHDVHHVGSGRIVRGSGTYYPSIMPGQANSLYCDVATGDDNNDGIDEDHPVATRAKLFNILPIYGGVSPGRWNLYLGAGQSQERFDSGLFQASGGVYIYGPDVSGGTPTAVLDGNSNNISSCVVGPFGKWFIYDVAFNNFNGNGITSQTLTRTELWNVHASGNSNAGANAETNQRFYIFGGNFSNNASYGARMYSGVTGSVRVDSRNGGKAKFDNNGLHGMQIREFTNVRADDFSCDGNGQSGVSVENARAHLVNGHIDNSPIGVRQIRGAMPFLDNMTYGAGVVTPEVSRSGAVDLAFSNSLTPRSTLFSSSSTVTGSTSRQLVRSVTIPARYFNSNEKIVRVRAVGSLNVTTAATIGIDYGGAEFTNRTTPSTSTSSFMVEFEVVCRGDSSQIATGRLHIHSASNADFVRVARTYNTNPEKTLSLSVTLGNSSDSINIEYVQFEFMG